MQVDYVLCATGRAGLPRINHGINFHTVENAILTAQETVAALSKAGYFSFTLYDTRRIKADADIEIARFTVEEQEPLIIVK